MGTKCSTGRADFPRVGSPLVNWPCLTHSSPTSYAAKDVLHTRTISIGSHNCHFLRIFKLVLNFLQVRLRPCPLAIGHSMGNGLLTHLTSVLRLLSFTKSSNLWPETSALSVGVLALIPALPSGSEVRVKGGCFFLSQFVHKRSLRDRISPLCDSNMVSVLTRHSAGTCLLSFKRR
jgi:hypothetical protein